MSKVKYYYDPNTLSYKKIRSEKKSIVQLFAGFVVTTFIGLGISLVISNKFFNELHKSTGIKIDERIENLEKISTDLESLSLFIANQKIALKEQYQILTELKNENQKLEKVVGMNKNNVETLFQIQDEKVRKRIWTDRVIGFLFGLAGSFLISLLFRLWDKRNRNSIPDSDDEIYFKKEKNN